MKKYIFKILVAGEGGAGKTSLLQRYVDDRFEESNVLTVGVDFFTKQIALDNAECLFQLWDLGGQKRFRGLLNNFVMGARGALLLFDLTTMPNVNDILEWVNIARIHDLNLPILLVGTKFDLDEFLAVDDDSALHLKNTFNMVNYIKTSAKTGYNVEKAFESLAKTLINLNQR